MVPQVLTPHAQTGLGVGLELILISIMEFEMGSLDIDPWCCQLLTYGLEQFLKSVLAYFFFSRSSSGMLFILSRIILSIQCYTIRKLPGKVFDAH